MAIWVLRSILNATLISVLCIVITVEFEAQVELGTEFWCDIRDQRPKINHYLDTLFDIVLFKISDLMVYSSSSFKRKRIFSRLKKNAKSSHLKTYFQDGWGNSWNTLNVLPAHLYLFTSYLRVWSFFLSERATSLVLRVAHKNLIKISLKCGGPPFTTGRGKRGNVKLIKFLRWNLIMIMSGEIVEARVKFILSFIMSNSEKTMR